ncbi:hypothetical protein L1887_58132 [Cichorium endivia]|nr:hypothetical protein L1887_58132 [Cichorium endivia]
MRCSSCFSASLVVGSAQRMRCERIGSTQAGIGIASELMPRVQVCRMGPEETALERQRAVAVAGLLPWGERGF